MNKSKIMVLWSPQIPWVPEFFFSLAVEYFGFARRRQVTWSKQGTPLEKPLASSVFLRWQLCETEPVCRCPLPRLMDTSVLCTVSFVSEERQPSNFLLIQPAQYGNPVNKNTFYGLHSVRTNKVWPYHIIFLSQEPVHAPIFPSPCRKNIFQPIYIFCLYSHIA